MPNRVELVQLRTRCGCCRYVYISSGLDHYDVAMTYGVRTVVGARDDDFIRVDRRRFVDQHETVITPDSTCLVPVRILDEERSV